MDFSIYKSFAIREGMHLQFRANAYNLANTPQFTTPNTTLGATAFGVVSLSTVNDPRIVELALKLNF